MFKRDSFEPHEVALAALVFVTLFGAALLVDAVRWSECRRLHPFWYCATQE